MTRKPMRLPARSKIDEWVGATADAPALPAPDAPKEKLKRLTIDLPPAAHQAFKVACAKRGVNMVAVTVKLIEDWTKANG